MAIYLNGQLVAGSNAAISPFIIVDQFDESVADQTKIYFVKDGVNQKLKLCFCVNNSWYYTYTTDNDIKTNTSLVNQIIVLDSLPSIELLDENKIYMVRDAANPDLCQMYFYNFISGTSPENGTHWWCISLSGNEVSE